MSRVSVDTGPSPHSAHYGETVGKWNVMNSDGMPYQPKPYGLDINGKPVKPKTGPYKFL